MPRMKPGRFDKFLEGHSNVYNMLILRLDHRDIIAESLRLLKELADKDEDWDDAVRFERRNDWAVAMHTIARYDYTLQLIERLLGEIFEAYRSNALLNPTPAEFQCHAQTLDVWRDVRKRFVANQEDYLELSEDILEEHYLVFGMLLNHFVLMYRRRQYTSRDGYWSGDDVDPDSDDEEEEEEEEEEEGTIADEDTKEDDDTRSDTDVMDVDEDDDHLYD